MPVLERVVGEQESPLAKKYAFPVVLLADASAESQEAESLLAAYGIRYTKVQYDPRIAYPSQQAPTVYAAEGTLPSLSVIKIWISSLPST